MNDLKELTRSHYLSMGESIQDDNLYRGRVILEISPMTDVLENTSRVYNHVPFSQVDDGMIGQFFPKEGVVVPAKMATQVQGDAVFTGNTDFDEKVKESFWLAIEKVVGYMMLPQTETDWINEECLVNEFRMKLADPSNTSRTH